MAIQVHIVKWTPARPCPALEALLRAPPVDAEATKAAQTILDAVRKEGDRAIARYIRRFDGARLSPDQFRIPREEIEAAAASVPAAFRRAVASVRRRVERFARAGLRRDWRIPLEEGGAVGERYVALRRVGVYIPGGVAPLASTVLMTVPLARVAGVREIVACTPPRPDGTVDPHILCALHLTGATEVYRIGGVPAIAAMAFGTRTIPAVDKIVGPGGAYVAAAKRLVYGHVAVDMVAGPSEIAILADATARPDLVAADLLSQAEHGTGRERVLLATDSEPLARAVRDELARQAARLPRQEALRRVLTRNALLVVAPRIEEAAEIVNRFAPEHLEILTRNPESLARRVPCAGAIFLGHWTPESAGDFAAGPSHVLPTGGSARYFSGLTVEDFRRRISVIRLTRNGLAGLWNDIAAFARVEGLPAHARSAALRLGKDEDGA